MRIVLLLALIGCGGGGESEMPMTDAGPATDARAATCGDALTRFYESGCRLSRPNGSGIRLREVRKLCSEHIAASTPDCMGQVADFRGCLGGGGISTFCDGP